MFDSGTVRKIRIEKDKNRESGASQEVVRGGIEKLRTRRLNLERRLTRRNREDLRTSRFNTVKEVDEVKERRTEDKQV